MSTYARTRRKMFLNLADHCHDRAINEAIGPREAGQWMVLTDAALWAADPEGDADAISRLVQEFSAQVSA